MAKDLSITIPIRCEVDDYTAKLCMALLELYLNRSDNLTLELEDDRPGNWKLSFGMRDPLESVR